jgi:hypothetical protein
MINRVPLHLGHPSRTEQCGWLWYWLLYGPEARCSTLSLHLDHTGVELHESTESGVQDSLPSDLCPRQSYDRGIAERGQLPPILPWQSDVDA